MKKPPQKFYRFLLAVPRWSLARRRLRGAPQQTQRQQHHRTSQPASQVKSSWPPRGDKTRAKLRCKSKSSVSELVMFRSHLIALITRALVTHRLHCEVNGVFLFCLNKNHHRPPSPRHGDLTKKQNAAAAKAFVVK